MKKLIFVFIYLFLVIPCQARIITVDNDGQADFNNIQSAINDSNDGDTIIVADGIYTGDGNRDISFLGKEITLRSENGPEKCIIDCNGTETEPHRGFYFHNGEDSNSILEGFTITNGNKGYGAGIRCSSVSPKISNCVIINNTAEGSSGGGICCIKGYGVTVDNCIISENSAHSGGGLASFNDNFNPATNDVIVINCTFSANSAQYAGGAVSVGQLSKPSMVNCVLWGDTALYGPEIDMFSGDWGSDLYISFSNVQGGESSYPIPGLDWGPGNIDTDPCFAKPKNGDYHLKSQAGRWEPNSQTWVLDDVTSPCIDAGNPGCPIGDEPAPNGNRINMGAYGGTAEASKSPANWRSIADLTNDWVVDSNDLKVFVGYWLDTGDCIPSDLNRSQFVDFKDFAIFGRQWSYPSALEPGIFYQVEDCNMEGGQYQPPDSNDMRFSVWVEGRYIHFKDLITANCCADEIELQMTLEDGLITIFEIEHLTIPCTCICDYPATAILGPFEPGDYTLEVYEDYGGFIGSTTVVIEPP